MVQVTPVTSSPNPSPANVVVAPASAAPANPDSSLCVRNDPKPSQVVSYSTSAKIYHGPDNRGGRVERKSVARDPLISDKACRSRSSRSHATSKPTPSLSESELRRLRDQNAELSESLSKCKRQFEYAQKQWQTSINHRYSKAVEESARLNDIIRTKDDTIVELRKRVAESQHAHTFLTSDDRFSATDITNLLDALNYEILQVATSAAEYIKTESREGRDSDGTISDENVKSVYEQVMHFAGIGLFRELQNMKQQDDFIMLQLAVQAALCDCCSRFLTFWDNTVFGGGSGMLLNMYQMMRGNEPQSVFARWRALTQRQFNDLTPEGRCSELFAVKLRQSILKVAVVANIQDAASHKSISTFLDSKLATIVSHAHRIQNAITLDVFSADFSLVHIKSGAQFEHQTMRDTFETSKAEKERVACTTELGLMMIKKVMKGGESSEESTLLLAPQVLLMSSLDECSSSDKYRTVPLL